MALILDRLRRKPKDEPVRNTPAGPLLDHDIQRENIETNPPEDRLNSRTGSIVQHIKNTWTELKSLKHKF